MSRGRCSVARENAKWRSKEARRWERRGREEEKKPRSEVSSGTQKARLADGEAGKLNLRDARGGVYPTPRVFFVRVANKGVMLDAARKSGSERT